MLIRFTVANFRSFRDLQELSMVASKLKDSDDSVESPAGFARGLLRAAAIYGANASGKTTILRALEFAVKVVRDSHRSWKPDTDIPLEPFLLDQTAKLQPSSFRIDFLMKGVRYEFGFELTYQEILKEWLYCFPNGRRQLWYERKGGPDKQFRFGKHLAGENRTIESLTRPNSLFLSAGAQNNHEQLLRVFSWLTKKIRFEFGSRNEFNGYRVSNLCKNPKLKQALSTLLASADLGIVGLNVETEKVHFEPTVREALKGFLEAVSKSVREKTVPQVPTEIPKVLLQHRSTDPSGVIFPNAIESSGTAAFITLVCLSLKVIESGGILCVDELDSSLHPLLALEIVRIFTDPQKNPLAAQLIFNTHDVNLLDSSILRRDQIWFTEKDKDGSAHLYSLSDFKPRRNENFKRGYLQGRYGAVPFLTPFEIEQHSD